MLRRETRSRTFLQGSLHLQQLRPKRLPVLNVKGTRPLRFTRTRRVSFAEVKSVTTEKNALRFRQCVIKVRSQVFSQTYAEVHLPQQQRARLLAQARLRYVLCRELQSVCPSQLRPLFWGRDACPL